MRKVCATLLGLVVFLPLAFGCDTGTAGNAVSATVTAVAPDVNGAATAVSGAAGAAVSTVSAADAPYLNQANALAIEMQTSPEILSAIKAVSDAATQGAAGQTVDTKTATDSINAAMTAMNSISTRAAALQAPADVKSVQDSLTKAISEQTAGFQAALTAIGSQNWGDMTKAAGQLSQAATDATTLLSDLAARGVK